MSDTNKLADKFTTPNTTSKYQKYSNSTENTNNFPSNFTIMDDGSVNEYQWIDIPQLQFNNYTGEHYPLHSHIYEKYKFFPSKLQLVSITVSENILNYLYNKGFKLIFQKLDLYNIDLDLVENNYNIDIDNEYGESPIKSLVLENETMQCCIDIYINTIHGTNKSLVNSKGLLNDLKTSINIEIYYNYTNVIVINDFVKELTKILKKTSTPSKKVINSYVYLLNEKPHGLDISPHQIKKVKLDLHKFYNDDFISADKLLINKLKAKNVTGIAFLHGEHGTGKTTYIRHLINKLKNKKFIFVPRDLLNLLATPNFIDFLKNYPDSILILEDCGEVIKVDNHSSIVPNLLNYGDGLFGDILRCKIIITFNESIKEIDPRLTRGGRCFLNYEFKKLDKIKANLLNPNINENAKLSDIFNEKVYTNVNKTIVGFK